MYAVKPIARIAISRLAPHSVQIVAWYSPAATLRMLHSRQLAVPSALPWPRASARAIVVTVPALWLLCIVPDLPHHAGSVVSS